MKTSFIASRASRLAANGLLIVALALFGSGVHADPDLPGATANLKTLPSGSYVIAMDNSKQNIGNDFNLFAYGLIVDLLHNDIPLEWVIKAGKVKDEADFSANVRRVYPDPVQLPAIEDFKAGPLIIHRDFVPYAIPRIVAFGNDVAIYELLADTEVDVRHTLSHKPRVAILNDGGKSSVHEDVLAGAGLTTPAQYGIFLASNLPAIADSGCYTIGTEPHWDEDPNAPIVDFAAGAVRTFLVGGGNFLAQCAAIEAYENNMASGHFQTTNGIFENNTGSDPFLYPNADLPYTQFEGILDAGGGTIHDWTLNGGTWANNGHSQVQNVAPETDRHAGSVSKIGSGVGGLAYYLSSHSYGDGKIEEINGRRMYLNAVITPARRPPTCVPVVLRTIAGTIYEDVNGDGALGDAIGADAVAVRLYGDNNNNGSVEATDTYIGSTTTDATGAYLFTVSQGLTGSNYVVVVDSKSVATATRVPSAVFNGGFGPGNVWAEQTYGDDPTTAGLDVGLRYGGRNPSTSDDFDSASTLPASNAYEHLAWVNVATADVAGVDFAFSFNVVTHTRSGDDDGSEPRTIQGSVGQFLQNANAVAGANAMRFVPAVAPNASGSGGDWWQVAVSGAALPTITDGSTEVNGTAYCAWDDGTSGCTATTEIRDDNSGTSGNPAFPTKPIGTGADGVAGTGDEPSLPDYNRPELEIDANDLAAGLVVGAADATITRVAIFNTLSSAPAVDVTAGTGGLVTDNFIGTRADGTDPGVGFRTGVGVQTSAAADVTNNLIAFTGGSGIFVQDAAIVSGNEIYSVALETTIGDGITTEGSSGQAITIRQNRTDQPSGFGIETWNASGPFTIEDNTVSRSGLAAAVEIGGIRIFGTGSTVQHNIVTGSTGPGIVLVQRGAPGSNQANRISQNSIYANGGLSIDLDITNTGAAVNPNGDGVTGNDGLTDATLPNLDMDYPVFTVVRPAGSSLYVEGYVGTLTTKVAGVHTVEVFKVDDDGNNDGEIERGDALSVAHGEGRWFIDSCSTAADGTFACTLTLPASVTIGLTDEITGTATDAANNTSEMSASTGASPLVIVKRAFQIDGTPIASGSTFPTGMPVRFMLYVSNPGPILADVSLQDVLDPVFAYVPGSASVTNAPGICALASCSAVEERAIFDAAEAGTAMLDPVDLDVFSFSGVTIDIGNQNALNGQLDLAANRTWAIVFTVRMQ